MKFLNLILLFLLSNILLGQELSENYTLSKKQSTSAGVYNSDGVLLRTLWSNVEQTAGTHFPSVWDGLDDYGIDVSSQGHHIKVITNDIQVEWEGVIGNLSDSYTSHIHKEFNFYRDMLIHDGHAYFSSGWTEGAGSVISSSLTSMGVTQEIMSSNVQQQTDRLATDGVRLYMAGRVGGVANISYVQAAAFENLGDFDAFEDFEGATVDTGPMWGNNIFKATDIVDSYDVIPNPDDDHALELAAPQVTGLAVQKTGSYMFVAREHLNSLHILHKITGELLHSLTYSAPKHTKVDADDNLWMVYDNANGNEVVEKFTVNPNSGAITSTGFTIEEINNVQAMTFNPGNKTLAIADVDINDIHKVKGYSISSASLEWTVGREESYKDIATVYDDKFMFAFNTDDDPYISPIGVYSRGYKDRYSFLAYEEDGSLWINDRGNSRYQKFNPINGEYLDQMMWQRAKYNVQIDDKDPTRVFYDYLEFEVDYDKPLQAKNENGAWRLVNNWAGGIPLGKESFNTALKDATTLDNGRTYALIPGPGQVGRNFYSRSIVELVDGGTIRETGVDVGYQFGFISLKPDGTLRQAQGISGVQFFYEQKIIGFDANNNPILGPEGIWDSYDETGNYVKQDGARRVSGEMTSNGNMVIFDGSNQTQSGSGFHLAAWNKELGKFAFRTAREAHLEFKDPYPTDGSYDLRQPGVVQFRGNVALTMDDWIVWGYNGEFWEQRQTNKWHMVSEEGLFLRDFGVATEARYQLPAFAAGMAGNAFSPKIVKAGNNNDVYLWHNDESYHAGAHRWKITNLNSIQKFNLKICTDNCNDSFYTVGGTVSGLTGANSLTLTNNDGDAITLPDNGEFTFLSSIKNGETYEVAITNHINDQKCIISNSSGTISGGNIINININCETITDPSYTVGGHAYGLLPGNSITLQNNGGDDLIIDDLKNNGVFTFSQPLKVGDPYDVTIASQPTGQFCEFSDVTFAVPPSGRLRDAVVDGIILTCHVLTESNPTLQNTTDVLLETVKIYPNPANDLVNISGVQEGTYEIFNIASVKYISGDLQQNRTIVDIKDLSSGVYFIKIIESNQKIKVFKFIKE